MCWSKSQVNFSSSRAILNTQKMLLETPRPYSECPTTIDGRATINGNPGTSSRNR